MSVMKNIFHKISLPTMLILGLTVGFVGLAYAAIPDSQGVIHGCYRNSGLLANGQLRIIDGDSQTCNSNEAAISWNQTGPQGPPGPGTVIAKRLSVPYGHGVPPTDHNFITLPGYGDITVTCGDDGSTGYSGRLTYHNTSGETVYVHPNQQGNFVVAVPNGGTYGPVSTVSLPSHFFAIGEGSGSRVSELNVYAENVPDNCIYTASGISNQAKLIFMDRKSLVAVSIWADDCFLGLVESCSLEEN